MHTRLATYGAAGRGVWAVGTTVVRALESAADDFGRVRPGAGETRLFISPGYRFRVVAIPDTVAIGKDPLAFDPKQMRAAFDAGRALAKQPDPWSTVPPNAGDTPTWALEAIK